MRCCWSLVHHLQDSVSFIRHFVKVPNSFHCWIVGDAAAQSVCTFGKQFQNILKFYGNTFVNIFIESKITSGYS